MYITQVYCVKTTLSKLYSLECSYSDSFSLFSSGRKRNEKKCILNKSLLFLIIILNSSTILNYQKVNHLRWKIGYGKHRVTSKNLYRIESSGEFCNTCVYLGICGTCEHTLALSWYILTGQGVCYPCLRTRHTNIHCNGAC